MEQSVITFWLCYAIFSLVFSIIYFYMVRKSDDVVGDTPIHVLIVVVGFIFLNVIFSFIYPQFTPEYKNGYNDYPDDALYKQAKIIADDSVAINTAVWYCDGWEKAQKEEAKLTFEEIKRNISRKVVE